MQSVPVAANPQLPEELPPPTAGSRPKVRQRIRRPRLSQLAYPCGKQHDLRGRASGRWRLCIVGAVVWLLCCVGAGGPAHKQGMPAFMKHPLLHTSLPERWGGGVQGQRVRRPRPCQACETRLQEVPVKHAPLCCKRSRRWPILRRWDSGPGTVLCRLPAWWAGGQAHNQQVRNDYEAQWQASRDGGDDFTRKWGKGVRVPGDRCPASSLHLLRMRCTGVANGMSAMHVSSTGSA